MDTINERGVSMRVCGLILKINSAAVSLQITKVMGTCCAEQRPNIFYN